MDKKQQEHIWELIAYILERWDGICWRCGGNGFWFEQIDGPKNLRRVTCPNPACWREDNVE